MRIAVLIFSFFYAVTGFSQEKILPFKKSFNVSAIQELLHLSKADKLKRMEAEGVLVKPYKFSDSSLVAQFLDPDHFPEVSEPTIRLSAQADVWTLVHEYIHFLVWKNAPFVPLSPESQVNESKKSLLVDWQSYQGNNWRYLSEEHRRQILENFLVVVDDDIQKLLMFELEEVAIESYLREIYQSSKPNGFDEKAWLRSERYIKKSGIAGLGKLRELSVSCTDLQMSYQRENKFFPARAELLCRQVGELRAELVALLNKTGVRVYESAGDK